MKYSITDFQHDFPDDIACLNHIFQKKYPNAKYYRIKHRKAYVNSKGHQVYPLKGTIFEKSRTPLHKWFFAIYLFSVSKNGVSAKELQRQLGVTYKCAWRLAHKIRLLMKQKSDLLTGTVEVDEAFIGWRRSQKMKKYSTRKTPVLGMVKRKGEVRAIAIEDVRAATLIPLIKKNVKRGSRLMTDEYRAYRTPGGFGYKHGFVNHSKWQWAKGDITTNTIEGFWGQLKKSLSGTYSSVSKQHLQIYLDEFVWRYNHRSSENFHQLLDRL